MPVKLVLFTCQTDDNLPSYNATSKLCKKVSKNFFALFPFYRNGFSYLGLHTMVGYSILDPIGFYYYFNIKNNCLWAEKSRRISQNKAKHPQISKTSPFYMTSEAKIYSKPYFQIF